MILVSTVHFNKLICTSLSVCEARGLEKVSFDIDFQNSMLCTPNKNVASYYATSPTSPSPFLTPTPSFPPSALPLVLCLPYNLQYQQKQYQTNGTLHFPLGEIAQAINHSYLVSYQISSVRNKRKKEKMCKDIPMFYMP